MRGGLGPTWAGAPLNNKNNNNNYERRLPMTTTAKFYTGQKNNLLILLQSYSSCEDYLDFSTDVITAVVITVVVF
jgi:hypothetical protein